MSETYRLTREQIEDWRSLRAEFSGANAKEFDTLLDMALRALQAPAIPAGWKLVPVEPGN